MSENGISVYVVPSKSGAGSECRIVECDGFIKSCEQSYLERPSIWREVGMMNSRGELIFLSSRSENVRQGLEQCIPIVGGMEFFFE